jgi:ABC-type nitrate/sulfonate/bicarbonate transport system permease component
VNAKAIYTSRTFWVFLAILVLLAFQWLTSVTIVPAEILAPLEAVAAVLMRWVTSQPVTLTGVKAEDKAST